MQTRPLGSTGEQVSVLGLGGHEFYLDGRIKGFSDHPQDCVRAGYRHPGFGGADRRSILQRALDLGINYLDTTIDPEIQALGRNLRESPGHGRVLIQARPQGMVYNYDPDNRRMANRAELLQEVDRILSLLGRDQLDVLNFAFEAPALLADPDYLEKIAANIAALKESRKIRYAACDALQSGETHYLKVMRRRCFDLVWISYSLLNPYPAEQVFPLAQQLGMGVVVREAFVKGSLFRMAGSSGFTDLYGTALRWILQQPAVSTIVVGVRDPAELEQNASAVQQPFSPEDAAIVDRLVNSSEFKAARMEQKARFRS